MFFSKNIVVSALIISSTQAFSLPEISLPDTSILTRGLSVFKRKNGGQGGCPAVWTNVAKDLTTMFLDPTTSQCNDDARAAIRAGWSSNIRISHQIQANSFPVFHDCGTWSLDQGSTGGCDGSLILANEAYDRAENNGLQDISTKLLALSKKWNVGVADLIVVASSVAVATCPKGPQIQTYVGRVDSSTPAPDGKLPDMHASGASLYQLFLQKGINAKELAALIGAHTSSKSFHQTPPGVGDVGAPQDSTPGIWDVKFYAEVSKPKPVDFVFQSDINLAADPNVGKEFKKFVGQQERWNDAFYNAMLKMSLFGVPNGKKNLIDCTKVIPKGTSKRDMRAAPIDGRAY